MNFKNCAVALCVSMATLSFTIPSIAADCLTTGQQYALEQGGTLTKADRATIAGKEVCVIVVLVPGKDGERPKRLSVEIDAG